MSDFDEAEYQAAIPACCQYQTVQEHVEDLMLCWGLCAAIRAGKPMDCTGCDLNVRPAHSAASSRGDG